MMRQRIHAFFTAVFFFIAAGGMNPLIAQDAIIVDGQQTLIITAKDLGPYQPQARADLAKTANLIVEQTNAFRKSQKLEPVVRNEQLNQTALDFAIFMAKFDKYGHKADDTTLTERVAAHKYEFCSVAENIAMQFHTHGFTTRNLARAFVDNWEKSPGHRANMVRPEVTQTGVAVSQSRATGTYYAVQLFGRPKDEAFEFVLLNHTAQTVEYRVGKTSYTLDCNTMRQHILCLPASLVLLCDGQTIAELTPQQRDRLVVKESGGQVTIIPDDDQAAAVSK